MPVRFAIHSSLVSTTASSSALVTRVDGAHEPMPTNRARDLPRPAAAMLGEPLRGEGSLSGRRRARGGLPAGERGARAGASVRRRPASRAERLEGAAGAAARRAEEAQLEERGAHGGYAPSYEYREDNATLRRPHALMLLPTPLLSLAAAAPRCGGLDGKFFTRFDSSLVHFYGGGADLWNASGFVASDSGSGRLRIDWQTHVRGLSSAPLFLSESSSLFVRNATARSVSAAGCTVVPSPFPPSAGACVGSISRFMPPGATDTWASARDEWLGYQQLDGVNVSVWGWTKPLASSGVVNEMHRVFLKAAHDPGAGQPIFEEQGYALAEGYSTMGRVRFSTFEDIFGSSILFNSAPIFEPPLACHFELPKWDPSTGLPPYDENAYKCSSPGFAVVHAQMHTTTDSRAFYTWPTLSAEPPKSAVTQVPHEGGPGPEVTCFAKSLQ
ncbi:hypothetical protein AB1Y20_017636 [Prymnesium parvum]|uniref:Uncharacterized protein n=1 Tax=Prymnesium parvum TaxID=97485 RepID=A0AB34JNQ8_PRYPA